MKLVSRARRQTNDSAAERAASEVPSETVVLSNGRYAVRLSQVGSGFSRLNDIAVTRCTGDETRDADGFHLYLRDLDSNLVWSVGYQPTHVRPSRYEFHAGQDAAEIVREDKGIECRLTVFVVPQHDCEIRLCRLTNSGNSTRRIEITSYLEWVLGSQEGDMNHPAFSKLFVETQFCQERCAIVARRRPRHNDDSEFWGVHSILRDGDSEAISDLEFETNRLRFIGRGRTLQSPIALCTNDRLTGDQGPVLDPIASFRTVVTLNPGESREVAFLLGAGKTRADIEDQLGIVGDLADVHALLDAVTAVDGVNGKASSVSPYDIVETLNSRAATQNGQAEGNRESAIGVHKVGTECEFKNEYGEFSPDGREYVIRLRPDGRGNHRRPPMPWTNVVANEQAGFLITESGAGYTWNGNSRLNRLSAWHNDPVCDPHGEALWLHDEDDGAFWSPTPGPTPTNADYVVRHGMGYSVFEHTSHGLAQEVTVFMAREKPLKLTRVRIRNTSNSPRRLSLYSYVHWGLGGLASETAVDIRTGYSEKQRVIWATNPNRGPYSDCVAFSSLSRGDSTAREGSFTCDRAEFLGRYGDIDSPAAVATGKSLDGATGEGLDPCAVWKLSFEIRPGETVERTFLLGEAGSQDAISELVHEFGSSEQIQAELETVEQFWRDTVSAITIETPEREIDLMVNGWLCYQNLSCRIWARSAYYQPGGAFGFRDQLQDSSALIYHQPVITRTQILRHAAQQFVEGDVLHWWHPDTGYGLRTRFSDDLLWLPCLTAEYVEKTGDEKLLDENAPFITAPTLPDGEQEAYLRPEPANTSASVYEHCCRALDRGLTIGPHGLPLIGCGDWNDGFSRVGQQGRGESVWLGFFIDYALERMLPVCKKRGDTERVARYESYRKQLRESLNSTGWDGQWYRRAYYDNGEPIGSSESDECQIDALVQAWAVISGVAPADRAESAFAALEKRLVNRDAGIIHLLTPPFDRTPNDPGYIKGYLRGIRENGGQYTHGVLWVIRALAEMGRGTQAVELLRMLTPVWHTSTPQRLHTYQTEPYVVAADIYGEAPHLGRGGWTWYTGSAGWMFRVAVESIFGFTTERGRTLVVNPSISSKWPQCKLTYRLPNSESRYEITIENPNGKERGVSSATVDGQSIEVVDGAARVPIVDDGALHRLVIRL
jgi:N,N'-diacetylchitobiose phosphorylase